jgi:hypothetical protein
MRSVRASDILLFHLLSFPSNSYINISYPSHLKPFINRASQCTRTNVQVPRCAVKIPSTTTSRNNANDNASTTSSLVPNAPSSFPTALGTDGDWSAYLDESKGLIYYFNPQTGESRCAYHFICSTVHHVNRIIVSPPYLTTCLFTMYYKYQGSHQKASIFHVYT